MGDTLSGTLVGFIIFVVLCFFSAAKGKGGRKRRTTKKSRYVPRSNPAPRITVTASIQRSGRFEPVFQAPSIRFEPPSQATLTWQPPGIPVSVGAYQLPRGMVYLGKAGSGGHSASGWIIDPSLPVAASLSGQVENLGYWPTYNGLSIQARAIFLDWLASGASAPEIDIGYVFLYFYGLERRLIVDVPDAAETTLLIAELERLRSIYRHGGFQRYSGALIAAVETRRLLSATASTDGFVPDLTVPSREMPLPLKIAIARKIVAGEALAFELAAAGFIGLPWETQPLQMQPVDTVRGPFLDLLRLRFERAFPTGFKIRTRKDSRLSLQYHGAAAGLNADLATAGTEKLPDPATLTWNKLIDLATEVSAALEPMAKLVAYHPERTTSLAAFAVAPPELAPTIAAEARLWLEGLPNPIAGVRYSELAQHAIGASGAKWTIKHHRSIAEALAKLGRGIEPDPADGNARLDDASEVYVIADAACLQPKSPAFALAEATAVLLPGLIQAGDDTNLVERRWLDRISKGLDLPTGETRRLQARLRWLRGSTSGLAKAKRQLADASAAVRELAASSLAAAIAVSGSVEKSQVATLEKIYDALGVGRNNLYTAIHSAAATTTSAAFEPVTVLVEAPGVVHALPRPPQRKVAGLDEDRIRQIRQETERVSSVLADVFVEDQDVAPPEPVAPTGQDDGFAGLDNAHAGFLKILIERTEWERPDFEAAARAAGLMPDGSLEVINEWAFEQFDEPLLDDGNVLTVNLALLETMLGRPNAA